MSLKDFIEKHRKEIDRIVKEYYRIDVSNNRERKNWIMNDEGLYRWAHREGVNI